MGNQLKFVQMSLGCDPEFFFKRNGKVCGAEKVLPENGLVSKDSYDTSGKFIIDGVQAELNPEPNTCRANLGNEIGRCFRTLMNKIKEDPSLSVDFSQMATLTKKELNSLSEKAKTFGCAPSHNTYTKKESSIKLDGTKALSRAAGGHIHIGKFNNKYDTSKIYTDVNWALETPERMVPLLDILVGNTCVLVDKSPDGIKRRKHYGRAGDYRTPKHGLEYRTLSNFWLQAYPLMSLVMGLTRTAVLILANSRDNDAIEKSIVSQVKPLHIKKAINNCDFDLAYKNFKKIEDPLIEVVGGGYSYPLNENTINEFHHFITQPLGYWFKHDPVKHWASLPDGHSCGWETFAMKQVREDMKISNLTDKVMSKYNTRRMITV